eukprot:jgi/Ulvmu1/11753/UM008_0167.1
MTSALYRTVSVLGGATAAWAGISLAYGESPVTTAQQTGLMAVRAARDITAVAAIVSDYVTVSRIDGEEEQKRQMQECHERGAQRLLDLCFANSGVYIKFAQHIGQLDHLLPLQYVKKMREHALDRCPTSAYHTICRTFQNEFGQVPDDMFHSFEQEPFASASLAQVHRAVMHDGRVVAVKVQHEGLQETAAADVATITVLVRAVKAAFPAHDYGWLVDEVNINLPRELDFRAEADNADRCRRNFASKQSRFGRHVHIPEVHRAASSRRVLTMEYCEGASVRDPAALRAVGAAPRRVAALVAGVFDEMIFHFGDVHCDPHAANMLVRRGPGRGVQLVLLDHGLYRQIGDEFRYRYAALWHALIFADIEAIREHATAMNAGEMYPLFASMLTLRPWARLQKRSFENLRTASGEEDNEELKGYARKYQREISELLRRVPRELLLLLKTNDCLRSIDADLGRPLNAVSITARACCRALSEQRAAAAPHPRGLSIRLRGLLDRGLVEWQLHKLWLLSLLGRAVTWLRTPAATAPPQRAAVRRREAEGVAGDAPLAAA